MTDTFNIDRYKAVLAMAGKAEETVRCYALWVQRWADWSLDRDRHPHQLEPLPVRAWSTTLPPGHSSRMQAHAGMVWLARAVDVSEGVVDAIERPRKRTSPPAQALSPPDTAAMLDAADTLGRKGTVVFVGVCAGLRRSEIAQVQWEHVDLEQRRMTFWREKNDDWHTVPISQELAERLEPRHAGEGWLFEGRNRGHIAFGTVNKWVADVAEAAGIGHVAPHQLRKTCATRLYEATRDVFIAKEMLGHSKITTTQDYIGVGAYLVEEAMRTIRFRSSERPAPRQLLQAAA